MGTKFDHIEVHVGDIEKYCKFLYSLFEGGAHKVISKTGTSMFTTPENINIEVKRKKADGLPIMSGFCNPCLRRVKAKEFIDSLGFNIEKALQTEWGRVYFFKDHENVTWHVKDIQFLNIEE